MMMIADRLMSFIVSGFLRGPMVVVQHPAQALAPLDRSTVHGRTGLGSDKPVAEPLMITFQVIVRYEHPSHRSQRALPKQNHPLQAGLLDGSHKTFRVGV